MNTKLAFAPVVVAMQASANEKIHACSKTMCIFLKKNEYSSNTFMCIFCLVLDFFIFVFVSEACTNSKKWSIS